MTTLTRRQREVQNREERILEVALEMLVRHGYHGLNMDRIAEQLEYSKGTIYLHFPNKEEIVLALTNQAAATRLELFRRAASFRGRSRERLHAIGFACELFVRLFPHFSSLEQVVRLSSVLEKTSEERRNSLRACETQCMSIVAGVIRDAVATGDLDLPPHVAPESIVFGLWAMTFGGVAIFGSSSALSDAGLEDPWQALRQNHMMLVDGYGWKPLSVDYPLEAVQKRLEKEVFSAEVARLKKT